MKTLRRLISVEPSFDAVIGNPPYHIEDRGGYGGSSPLYHDFMRVAKESTDRHVSMIYPARWMQGGKGLSKFRETEGWSKHYRKFHDTQTHKRSSLRRPR